MSEEDSGKLVRVTSAYGYRTRQPFVNVVIGDQLYGWPADKAKEIGAMLIEVATAAEGDAFVFEWVEKTLGAGEERAAMILAEFRAWREARAKKASGGE